jgi:hypothetical protein
MDVKGLGYSDVDQYTLKLSELKTIVSRIKDTISNPEELNKWILRNTHLGKIGGQESHMGLIHTIKDLENKQLK